MNLFGNMSYLKYWTCVVVVAVCSSSVSVLHTTKPGRSRGCDRCYRRRGARLPENRNWADLSLFRKVPIQAWNSLDIFGTCENWWDRTDILLSFLNLCIHFLQLCHHSLLLCRLFLETSFWGRWRRRRFHQDILILPWSVRLVLISFFSRSRWKCSCRRKDCGCWWPDLA